MQPSITTIADAWRLPSEIAEKVEAFYNANPTQARTLLEQLLEVMPAPVGSNGAKRGPKPGSAGQAAKVIQALVDNANRWMTRRELEEAGVSEHTVHNFVYGANKEKLEVRRRPNGGLAKEYRLTQSALQYARGEPSVFD